ncbi:hypothetical protein AVEN_83387-1 [Araneus ventricosus]|uniref:CCHC-type domain-containing protein n=1 Tax=Araneus ventricosus TaxID=182803 RepID=A0A4Y2HJX5_ARAVE|nr:hypothetical protein AVEN_83387-1 [Araneus ventricosus]
MARKDNKKPSTLFLFPTGNLDDLTNIKDLLQKEANNSEIHIRNLISIQNKGLAVTCREDLDVQTLLDTINNKESLKATIIAGKRHPSIIIYNMPEPITQEEVNETFRAHAGTTEKLKLRFRLTDRQPGTVHWVMKASSKNFNKIQRLCKLEINWTMFQVCEFFHIKRCNKCQGFRHLAKDCPENRYSCANGAGHHLTRKCRSPHVYCVSCAMLNQIHGTRYPIDHYTSDSGFSCYKRKLSL